MAGRHVTQAVVRHCKAVRDAERLCAELLRAEAAVQVIGHSKSGRVNPLRPWISIRGSEGGEIAIAVEAGGKIADYFLQVVKLGAFLSGSNNDRSSAWVSLKQPQAIEGMSEISCLVTSAGDTRTVFLALGGPGTFPVEAREVARPPERKVLLPLVLYSRALPAGFPEPKAELRSEHLRWRIGRFEVTALEFTGTENDPPEIGRHQPRDFLDWRLAMSNDGVLSSDFPVQIEFGTIELSAQELLDLRPGDVISVAAQGDLVGTLRIAGEAWATVTVDRSAEGVAITVRELCIPEATSRRSSR